MSAAPRPQNHIVIAKSAYYSIYEADRRAGAARRTADVFAARGGNSAVRGGVYQHRAAGVHHHAWLRLH
eukprot:COSAG02_NODE_47074_length_343_cov_237.139344_1_plen_68_part_01